MLENAESADVVGKPTEGAGTGSISDHVVSLNPVVVPLVFLDRGIGVRDHVRPDREGSQSLREVRVIRPLDGEARLRDRVVLPE